MKEKTLFCRYDIKKITCLTNTNNLLAVLAKRVSYDCVRVIYIDTACGKRREQVLFYDLAVAILHFEDRLKSEDKRFVKSWNKYLNILLKLKK